MTTSNPPEAQASPAGPAGWPEAARTHAGQVLRGWWAVIIRAGALRLTYETTLALVMSLAAGLTTFLYDDGPLSTAASMVLAAGAALVLVPLRLVYPAAAFMGAAVVGVGSGDAGGLLLMVLSASVGYRMRHLGRTVLAFLAVLVCWLATVLRIDDMRDDIITNTVVGTAAFLVVIGTPGLVGWAVGRRRRVVRAMHWRNVQLLDQQTAVAHRARTRERSRIARDLHDSLGHQLTLISLYAGTLNSVTDEQREETITLLRATAASAMAELRQSLGVLRQADEGDEVGAAQPLTRLEGLADAARSAGAQFTLTRRGTAVPLPPLIEHAAYRVIQEGVTNALRHARGGPIDVTLRYESDTVVVEVANGAGAPHDAPTTGQGLIGLTERVRLAGGVLYHGSTDRAGYRLAAMLPYRVPAPDGSGGGQRTGETDGQEPRGATSAGDFEVLVRRSARRSRAGLIVATAVTAAVLGICVAASVIIAVASPTTVSPEVFDALRVGQREGAVRAELPAEPFASTGVVDGAAPPAGAVCVHYAASLRAQLEAESQQELVYRFCFRGGTLVAKDQLYAG